MLTLCGYIMVELGKVVSVWVSALDKGASWSTIPFGTKVTLFALLSVGIGQTFLAVKSRTYSDALKTPPAE